MSHEPLSTVQEWLGTGDLESFQVSLPLYLFLTSSCASAAFVFQCLVHIHSHGMDFKPVNLRSTHSVSFSLPTYAHQCGASSPALVKQLLRQIVILQYITAITPGVQSKGGLGDKEQNVLELTGCGTRLILTLRTM